MRPFYRFMRAWSQTFYALYFRGRVFGVRNVPRTGGVLLACNHQSFFDPVCSCLALPREGNFMARDTLFLNPFFRRLIVALNAFPVKRGAADVGAVKEILRRLRDGKLVVVFPEATRTRDGSIGEINPNSLLIAKKAGVAIVPTVIDGAFEAWPRTQLLPGPGRIYTTYAEAITPQQVTNWSMEKIAETVSERLTRTLGRSQARRHRAACPFSTCAGVSQFGSRPRIIRP